MESKRNFKGFKNKCTKNCPNCGEKLILHKIIKTPMLSLQEVTGSPSRSFYGGNVSRFSLTNCDKCGLEILLYLKSVGNAFVIHDVAITDEAIDNLKQRTDNVVEGQEPEKTLEEKLDEQEKDPDSIGNLEIDKLQTYDLIKAIKDLDLGKALKVMDMLTYGHVPKTLVAAGFTKEQVYTDQHRTKKKEAYVELVTEYINSAKEAIQEAKDQAAREANNK